MSSCNLESQSIKKSENAENAMIFAAGNTIPPRIREGKKRKISENAENAENAEVSEEPVIREVNGFHWAFTWNNHPKNWKDFFEDRRSIIEKFCAGEETCPTTGTPHIQGWIRLFKRNIPRTYLDLPKEIHWEKMYKQATEAQNTAYCLKKRTNILTWGIPVPYTISAPKTPWMIELKNILLSEPDFRSIYWIWETTGNTGKTLFTKMMYLELEHVIFANGKGHDIRHCVADYLNKKGTHPRVILMDIPRINKDYISYEAIENVKNMAFYSGKYEGTMVCGPNPHVIILANDRPDVTKLSDDRWKVGKIVEEKIIWE